jgi:lysophospholipase L1-like esterase
MPVSAPYKALLVLLCYSLLSGCGDTPSLPRLAPGAVLLAFGDSLTYGTGAGADESYPAVLADLTGYPVINAGVPGEESTAGLVRLPSTLAQHRPALLILCHGGNDMLRGRNLEKLAGNLRAMIDMARAHGSAVLLIGVPAPRLLGLQAADVYRDIAESTGITAEQDSLASILSKRHLKADAIHPNAQGYRLLAEAIDTLLRERGALPKHR